MSDDAAAALARTVQLIALDVFGSKLGDDLALDAAIVRGLQATTIRLVADAANLDSAAGQTALVSLFVLTAMMGVGIELEIPDVQLRSAQPPLRCAKLRQGLLEYAQDLIPNARVSPSNDGAPADLTFVFGDSPVPRNAGPVLRVTGTAWRCHIARNAKPRRWRGSWPIGALATAGGASAEAFRAALVRVAASAGKPLPQAPYWHFNANVRIDLDLSTPGLKARPPALGQLDFISGGAITTAAIFCLLRITGLSGGLRIIEPDKITLDNLNRYMLARRSDCTKRKIDLLTGFHTDRIRITGVPDCFDDNSRSALEPLAPRIMVGVDHIPLRWAVQSATDGFLCVAGTTHFYALVTTHHPGEPCAGCAHPRDDPGSDPIPTISFVSFWAGLMQARALLIEAAGVTPASAGMHIWPLGLDGPRALGNTGVAARTDCPVRCPASRAVA